MTRVLVTGAGGAAGVAVIRELLRSGHDPVAADPDPMGAGMLLAPERVPVGRADDACFVDTVRVAVERTGVEAVITTVSEEMPAIDEAGDAVAALGAPCWVSPADTVRVCIDKWRFAETLGSACVPTPATVLGAAASRVPGSQIPGPWVVKPRFGRGSRNVHLVDDDDELAWACRRTPDSVVQTRCTGAEFTVDALAARDGSVPGLVPRWRLETKAGISTRGRTFDDPRVVDAVVATVGALGLRGAINVQGFVDDDADPAVHIVEVNPRFSGGLPLSLAAGAELVGELLRGTLGLEPRPEHLRHRAGVTMTRHFEEIFTS